MEITKMTETQAEIAGIKPDAKQTKISARRAHALDALRGIAILGMILSGSIPFSGVAVLPAWMYHAQVPPPDHIFNPGLPGITWVDLVFPFFLFAMGAAIPLAMTKRIKACVPVWKLILQLLERGLLLAGFAIYIQHIKPYSISSDPDTWVRLISLLGFVLVFPMILRLPATMKPAYKVIIRIAGYLGAVILLSQLRYADGSGFLVTRSDIIILVLANVAFFGGVIWLFTQNNVLLRLGLLAFYLALRLTQNVEGSWNLLIWYATPAAWLYKLYYLQYLFIVIPGTIIGDMILKWMNSGESAIVTNTRATKTKYSLTAVLILLCLVINLYGLFTRALFYTLIADVIICIAGYLLLNKPENETGKLYKSLFNWGTYWLLLGLFFEAFEGGIKKDKSTLSYYFVTTGLAIFTYIAISICIDCFQKKKYFSLLIDSGQNPMIAYIAGSNFIMPVLAFTSLITVLNNLMVNPWLGFLKGLIFTMLVALTAAFFTRRKLFWRT
ncbi:MAG: DUF5009 domain-containing protein [Ignavibacteriales bacterium]